MKSISEEVPAKRKRKSRPSKAKAINDFCKQCIYDPLSGMGTWRQQVQACPCTECPLYPVRPLPASKRPKDPEQESK